MMENSHCAKNARNGLIETNSNSIGVFNLLEQNHTNALHHQTLLLGKQLDLNTVLRSWPLKMSSIDRYSQELAIFLPALRLLLVRELQ